MEKHYKLWNEQWRYSEEKTAIFEIFLSNQKAIREFYNTLCNERANSDTFKVTSSQYNCSIKVNPWIYNNMDTTCDNILYSGSRIEKILKSHHLELNINWNELINPWMDKYREVTKIFADFTTSVYENSAKAYVKRVEQTYSSELNKMEGLGFGIISNSLASHLIYASMSVKKERQNKQQASMNASAIVGLPQEAIARELAYQGRDFYSKYLEDMLMNLVIEYFAYIEKIISDGLEVNLDELAKIWSEHSADVYNGKKHITKEEVLTELKINPINADILAYALKNWGNEIELVQYCDSLSSSCKEEIHTLLVRIAIQDKEIEQRKIFNKPIIDQNNMNFWVNIKNVYEKIYGCIKWNELIESVYGAEIDECLTVTQSAELWSSERKITNYFDSKEKITNINRKVSEFFSSNKFTNFYLLCNLLQYAPAIKTLPEEIKAKDLTKPLYQEYFIKELCEVEKFVDFRLEKQKEYEDLEKQIDAMNKEISHLTFAIFGKKLSKKKN